MIYIALEKFQSLFQFSLGLSLALLYFYDRQVGVSGDLEHRLENLREDLVKLQSLDKRQMADLQLLGSSRSDKNRKKKTEKQNREVTLIERLVEKVRSTLWYEIHESRRSRKDLVYWCCCLGIFMLYLLIVSTLFNDMLVEGYITISMYLVLHLPVACQIQKLLFHCYVMEESHKRTLRRKGEWDSKDFPNLKFQGLNAIRSGRERFSLYYVEGQIRTRLEHEDDYRSRFQEPPSTC